MRSKANTQVPFSSTMDFNTAVQFMHENDKCTPDACHLEQHYQLLFVFDELQAWGCDNHWLMNDTYVGSCLTSNHYELMADGVKTVMLDRPGYSEHRLPVYGELWLVEPDTLFKLDGERFDNTTRSERKKIDVLLQEAMLEDYRGYPMQQAWAYFGSNVWWSRQRDAHIDLHRCQPVPMPGKENGNCLKL